VETSIVTGENKNENIFSASVPNDAPTGTGSAHSQPFKNTKKCLFSKYILMVYSICKYILMVYTRGVQPGL